MSQQRRKILFDSSLWSQAWFDHLPIEYQMTYLILWSESDNVGIWKPHFRNLHFKLKQDIQPEDFLSSINSDAKHIESLEDNKWWLIDYLPFQVPNLKPNNRVHVSYVEVLRSHGLLKSYAKNNPDKVKFEVIYELQDWKSIKNSDDKRKARAAYKYLEGKGLVRPLEEACKALKRDLQDSKEKEKDKNQIKDKADSKNKIFKVDRVENQEKPVVKLDDISYYRRVDNEIAGLARLNIGDLVFQENVDNILHEISDSGVQDPKQYLLDYLKKIDWSSTTWDDVVQQLLTNKDLPF